MEELQFAESPKKQGLFIKILIVLLMIAVIGQISAIFLLAFAGQSPDPLSFLFTALWVGALFAFVWKFKNKSKRKGFIIGAAIGIMLDFSAGVVAGYLQAETRAIDKAVENSNKELPKMIDEETRLDVASIDQKGKDYILNMTLVNLSLSEIDVNFIDETFEQSIKPSTCESAAFKVFFAENYAINYVYSDKSGQLVRKYTVKPTDCNEIR